jgi:uncharacterized protein DUF3300
LALRELGLSSSFQSPSQFFLESLQPRWCKLLKALLQATKEGIAMSDTKSARSKRISRYEFMALAALMILSVSSLPLLAQDQQGQQPPQQQPQPQQQLLTQQQLQQLVAPIALYPDALLAQVLTASTYPLEVTLSARWAEKNPNLKGPALEEAMQKEPWDPSVKGLTSVPQVLAMMNEKLDSTW